MSQEKDKNEWYLPDPNGIESKGPFSKADIISQLKAKRLHFDSYIWSTDLNLNKWVQVFEIESFRNNMKPYPICPVPKSYSRGLNSQKRALEIPIKPSQINKMEDKFSGKHRFPQAPLNTPIILHNQKFFIRGICTQISEKDIFVESNDIEIFQKGEEITLTVFNSKQLTGFSAPSVILNKSTRRPSRGYEIYFLRLNPEYSNISSSFTDLLYGSSSAINNNMA